MGRRLSAYYYSFDETGCDAIDAVLEAVAWAGKGYHNTEDWSDSTYSEDDKSCVDVIQDAANEAAKSFGQAASQAREQALLEARYAVSDAGPPETAQDGFDDDVAEDTIMVACEAIDLLTTPEAQAEVKRRIVAEWLEERAHANMFSKSGIAASRLLAALKESE